MIEYRKVELRNMNKSGYGGGGEGEIGNMVHSHLKRSVRCLIAGYNGVQHSAPLYFKLIV